MTIIKLLTKGISMARLHLPERMLKGLGAHNKDIPFAVLSVYKGISCRKG